MKRINHQTKALLSAALLFFFSFSGSFGQTIRVNKIYRDIGSVQMTGNNEIWAIFPDSNRIYVVGQGLLQDKLVNNFYGRI